MVDLTVSAAGRAHQEKIWRKFKKIEIGLRVRRNNV
jgi:hypothetical protein